jgi:hypothetical protein
MVNSEQYKEGTAAAQGGLRLTDNPYHRGITEESFMAYCDWLDGYLEFKRPGILSVEDGSVID